MDVQYNHTIHEIAKSIILDQENKKQYQSDCFKANICPVCAKQTIKIQTLNMFGDDTFDVILQKCKSCSYVYHDNYRR